MQKLSITTDRGIVELEKDEILQALYAPNSTLFYVDPVYEQSVGQAEAQPPLAQTTPKTLKPTAPQPQKTAKVLQGFAFAGGGLGHGVGMSQTGAYRLGELGWSNSRILSFYYPGTQLQPLTSAIVFWKEPERLPPLPSLTKSNLPKASSLVKVVKTSKD